MVPAGNFFDMDCQQVIIWAERSGQITTLLMQQGCDPGVTDLFAMLREEATKEEQWNSTRSDIS